MGAGLKRAKAATQATKKPDLTNKQRAIVERMQNAIATADGETLKVASFALEAVLWVFRYEPSGGYLHCEISDGNLESLPKIEDRSRYDGKRFSPAQKRRYTLCVDALSLLSIEGREFVCHCACGYDPYEWIEDHEKLGDDFEPSILVW